MSYERNSGSDICDYGYCDEGLGRDRSRVTRHPLTPVTGALNLSFHNCIPRWIIERAEVGLWRVMSDGPNVLVDSASARTVLANNRLWAGLPGGRYVVAVTAPSLGAGITINWIGDALVKIGNESMCSRMSASAPRSRALPRPTRRLISPRRFRR
jgi:hypothetical protein